MKPQRPIIDKTTSIEWYTPPRVFDAMDTTFDLDVASPGADVVPWIPARRCLTIKDDGRTTPWEGFVLMNSPYGLRNGMQKWLDKFVAHGNGVCLLTDATSATWWQSFASQLDCLLFASPRIQFIDQHGRRVKKSNPYGSTLGAIGLKGVIALRTAAANGLGNLFAPLRQSNVVSLSKAA
jgi:hypothetical protein